MPLCRMCPGDAAKEYEFLVNVRVFVSDWNSVVVVIISGERRVCFQRFFFCLWGVRGFRVRGIEEAVG